MMPSLLIALLLLSVVTGLLVWQLAAASLEAKHLGLYLERLSAEERERARMLEGRYQMSLVQKVAETLIDSGNRTAQGAHQEIAAASFDMLESIPATRGTAKVARTVHDTAANLAYGTVNILNKQSGKGLRKLIKTNDSSASGSDKNK